MRTLIIFLILSGVAYPIDYNRDGNVIEITNIDYDWSWERIFINDKPVKVQSIQFNGGGKGDHCVIKQGGETGPAFFDVTVEGVLDQRYKLFNSVKLKPYLDFEAGRYRPTAKVIIILNE